MVAMIQSDTVEFRGLSSRVSVVARDVEIEGRFCAEPRRFGRVAFSDIQCGKCAMGALSQIQNSVLRLGLLAILGICLHQSGQARVSEGGQRRCFQTRLLCIHSSSLLMQTLIRSHFSHTTWERTVNKQIMP